MRHRNRLRKLLGDIYGCSPAEAAAIEAAQRAAFDWMTTRTWPDDVPPGWRYHRCLEIEEALGCGYALALNDFAAFRAANHPQWYLGDEPARFAGEAEAEVYQAANAEAELAIRDACAAREEWPRWL